MDLYSAAFVQLYESKKFGQAKAKTFLCWLLRLESVFFAFNVDILQILFDRGYSYVFSGGLVPPVAPVQTAESAVRIIIVSVIYMVPNYIWVWFKDDFVNFIFYKITKSMILLCLVFYNTYNKNSINILLFYYLHIFCT